MVVRLKKKVNKMRGSRTYGYGSSKKHRGKGSKGGKGLAGSGKKGQQKKLKLMVAKGIVIGKRGFKLPKEAKSSYEVITTKYLLENLEDFLPEAGKLDKGKNTFELDLTKLGAYKLIAQKSFSAQETYKGKVIVSKATPKAVEYLESLGIEVEVAEQD